MSADVFALISFDVLSNLFFFLRERMCVHKWDGEGPQEKETENPKQVHTLWGSIHGPDVVTLAEIKS